MSEKSTSDHVHLKEVQLNWMQPKKKYLLLYAQCTEVVVYIFCFNIISSKKVDIFFQKCMTGDKNKYAHR